MAYSQKNTIFGLKTPFGDGALLLVRFYGEERISGCFRFDLEMIAPERALDFKKVVGKGVTVTLRLSGGKERFFHGIVYRFVQAGRSGKETSYRAEVYPWLWLLTKTRDSRIFQNKSVPDIVKEIFNDHGFSDFKDALKGTYAKREYCVQYQESAFDFVSRLLEEEGIYYFFEHEDGKHTLVLADDASAHKPAPHLDKARYTGPIHSGAGHDSITELAVEQEVVAGGYAMGDFNFETPSTSLNTKADGKADTKGAKLKIFEYPGNYEKKPDGESRTKIRIEAEEALAQRINGTSLCRSFSAGYTFKLVEHDRDDANTDYVLRSVVHNGTNEEYSNVFEAYPKKVHHRPPRVTPKPTIAGAQTAIVVGKSGEEIWTDKYGRIKVHFHWDRLGAKDEKSSCWIRVAQGWAGKGWGSFFLPRIGQEVVVSFLGGDPDRPLVTGSVYNAEQTVPYALPDNQTKSTTLSRSSKKGSAGNEIRFEDKKDSEEIYVHAQKDMNIKVEHDWTSNIKHDVKTTIKNSRTVKIEESDDTLTIVKGNRKIEVQKGNETHEVKGTRDVIVVKDESHTNKAGFKQDVTKDFVLKVKGNITIEATGSVTIKAGTAFNTKAGTAMTNEAGTALTNKGMTIENNASTSMTNKAGVALTNKGGATQTVEGGGMLTLKGGLVKIN